MDQIPANRETVKLMISSGDIPWKDFVWKTSSHYVMPAIYALLSRNGLLSLLPDDLVVYLEKIYSLNKQRNLQLMGQCRDINSLLRDAGIRPLFFKGAGLLFSEVFQDPAERMMEDIDVLIPPEAGRMAVEALLASGYGKVKGYDEETYRDHHHLPPLRHPRNNIAVELHLAPYHGNYLQLASPEAIFQRAITVGADQILVPAHSDSLLICFAHEHLNTRGYLSRSGSMKGMYDFYLLSGKSSGRFPGIYECRFGNDFRRMEMLVHRFFVGNETEEINSQNHIKDWMIERFLLDHPFWDKIWNSYFYRFLVMKEVGFFTMIKNHSKRKRREQAFKEVV